MDRPISDRRPRLRRRRWLLPVASSPARRVAHATAPAPPAPPTALGPGKALTPPYLSPLSPSFLHFRTRSGLNHRGWSSQLRPQAPPRRQLASVIPEHPPPRRSHPCTSGSKDPPPIGWERHQAAGGTFFPNSGRHCDFFCLFFSGKLRPDSVRRKHPCDSFNLPVALTCAGFLSSVLSTLSPFAPPRVSVASSYPAASSSPRHSGELLVP